MARYLFIFASLLKIRSHNNHIHFFPLTGGCSEGLGAFRFFFKPYKSNNYSFIII